MVVLDGGPATTRWPSRLWPDVPVQRCWWRLPGRCAGRSTPTRPPALVNTQAGELAGLLRAAPGAPTPPTKHWPLRPLRRTVPQATTPPPSYLAGARDHVFTCLDPELRRDLARLGGPELGTGLLERVMRELNARTDIGGSRWSVDGLRDLSPSSSPG